MLRIDPEASRTSYNTEKKTAYDPNLSKQPDWDVDGIPDTYPSDQVFGEDVPEPLLPGESYEEYLKRERPDASREAYEMAKRVFYNAKAAVQQDWDLDGIPDNDKKHDQVYGDEPDPVTTVAAIAATKQETTKEKTTQAQKPSVSNQTNTSNRDSHGSVGSYLFLLLLIGGFVVWRFRRRS